MSKFQSIRFLKCTPKVRHKTFGGTSFCLRLNKNKAGPDSFVVQPSAIAFTT